jgi:hypothetical protein
MRRDPEVFIPNYLERKDFYDMILRIGVTDDTDEENGDDTGGSLSERFRSSIRNDD